MAELSTQSYKGTRDFYPEDMRLQRYIFDVWRKVSEKYGYEEYDAPILEYTDLYRAKTGEEIVSEQTYSFIDRGGRDVTIRPEMTPSLARMVAARQQELSYPLRWYSIPNLWRYERPQHGRLREHWQLNVDIFGQDDSSAELELITLSTDVMHNFGATDDMFTINLNSRELMSLLLGDYLQLNVDKAHRLTKLLDRKAKMKEEAFVHQADAILGSKLPKLLDILKTTKLAELPAELRDSEPAKELAKLAANLRDGGVTNIKFDITIQRGFDYYTGIVFEIFDTDPENNRSMIAGGRYDELLNIFKAPRVPAAGFGMGDVTIADFLRAHNLVPELGSVTRIYVAVLDDESEATARDLATRLREAGVNVALDVTGRKAGAQIKAADKKQIPYVVFVGEQETKTGQFALKELKTGVENQLTAEQITSELS